MLFLDWLATATVFDVLCLATAPIFAGMVVARVLELFFIGGSDGS